MKLLALVATVLIMGVGSKAPTLAHAEPTLPPKAFSKAHTVSQTALKPQNEVDYVGGPVIDTGGLNCGDNPYKQYIYMHESGCKTNDYNSIGCRGLGQACPGSKLTCSDTDFVCQDTWFSAYADRAYGGWENAYYFWLQNKWW